MSASLRGGAGGIIPSCVGFVTRTTYRGGGDSVRRAV